MNLERGLILGGIAGVAIGGAGLFFEHKNAEDYAESVQTKQSSEEVLSSRNLINSYMGSRDLLLEVSPETVQIMDNYPKILLARDILDKDQRYKKAYSQAFGGRPFIWLFLAFGGSLTLVSHRDFRNI